MSCLVWRLIVWLEWKSVWLDCPYFADVPEGFAGLEPSPVIAGIDEVVEVAFEPSMAIVMIAFDVGQRADAIALQTAMTVSDTGLWPEGAEGDARSLRGRSGGESVP